MNKVLLSAIAGFSLVSSLPLHAQPQVSPDGRTLMKLASITVGIELCGLQASPGTTARLQEAIGTLAEKQQDFTREQFDAALQGIATNMQQNKANICSQMTDASLDGVVQSALTE